MNRTGDESSDITAPSGQDATRPRRRLWLVSATLGGTLLISAVAAGAALAVTSDEGWAPADSVALQPGAGRGSGSPFGPAGPGGPNGGGVAPDESATATLDVTDATDEQEAGVVIIEAANGYSRSVSAGTGIVLTSDGLVLTNNHVIEGSTEITVTVPATGQTYEATVIGRDATADIAVIELEDASGLDVADLDDDGDPGVGDEVTGVGNAYGEGELVAAAGTVTALDQTITASTSYGAAGETLQSLIEVDADIVAGDSGGPLLDDEGEVVGVNTAATDTNGMPAAYSAGTDIAGYAIPIDDAMQVVDTILAGQDTDTVTIGYPAFLGVELATGNSGSVPGGMGRGGWSEQSAAGAAIAGVVDGGPAASAGLRAGDTITAVDGVTVGSADDLRQILDGYDPGDSVELTWTSTDGGTQTATVTLTEGPAA
ncbi:S1C family serine protease [Jiangella asiatica]|uniref:PDZ domain-containing protein n=1 Tax=Jiangella asiatica TaxID=2530372 RepID=A0A4R5D9A8_9ACTN|nr:trypsin-like peptidase domain-containing protein [Jiangella asiatica]TDE10159.1 PDZ domain-containing protein [Jiangella asiatica]